MDTADSTHSLLLYIAGRQDGKSKLEGRALPLQLDLDESERERVGVADVVLDADRAKVRLAYDQLIESVAGTSGRKSRNCCSTNTGRRVPSA